MGHRNQKPRSRKRRGSKRIQSQAPPLIDYNSHPPHFSFEYMDRNLCISNCDRDERARFAKKLHELSQLTWRQITLADRHGNGSEKIRRSSLKPAIPGHVTDDVDFIALRFCGKKPMVGYRRERVFYVIWFDVNWGDIYDH